MTPVGFAPGWQVRCVSCGWTVPAAELGIVRVGAWSYKKFLVGRCRGCGRIRFLAVERAPAPRTVPDPDR